MQRHDYIVSTITACSFNSFDFYKWKISSSMKIYMGRYGLILTYLAWAGHRQDGIHNEISLASAVVFTSRASVSSLSQRRRNSPYILHLRTDYKEKRKERVPRFCAIYAGSQIPFRVFSISFLSPFHYQKDPSMPFQQESQVAAGDLLFLLRLPSRGLRRR